MDMDLHDLIDFLHSAARSVGAEVTSPWFYLQLGLILAGAGIAFGAGAAIRSRINLTSLGMGWPIPLRLVIRLVTSVIRNAFLVRLVSLSAWLVAALSIVGQLDPVVDQLDSVAVVLGGLRLTPLLLIKLGVLLIAALWLTNLASNFAESRITQSTDLTPSIQVLL